jgi:hypothetical protein
MWNVSPERLKLIAVSALIIALFIPSRIFLLYHAKPAGTDTELYARYAYIHGLAAECHLSFHDCYRTMGLADISGPGPKTFDSLAMTVVAYPPFAVAMMSVPAIFVQGGTPISRMSMTEFIGRYKKAYPWLCAAAELLMVIIVSFLVLRLYKDERLVITVLRMGLLCLAGMCMPRILYNRLDVLLSALLIVSLAALIKEKPHLLLSFFVFALAVTFKLIPLFLLPVWILGSLRQRPDRHLLKAIIPKGLQLSGIIAGTAFFFFLLEGKGVFDFLAFHLDRGIHIESTWGVLSLFAAKISGTSFRMALSSGAYNVYTPAAGLLSVVSSIILFIAMLAVTILFAARCLKKSATAETRVALLGPREVIEGTLLCLLIVFSFAKIFSPQYLIVLIPLVALLPRRGKGDFVFFCVFLGTCCFTTFIYPHCYTKAIIQGPTPFGLFLLIVRTLLLCGMTVFLFVRTFRAGDGGLLGRSKNRGSNNPAIS